MSELSTRPVLEMAVGSGPLPTPNAVAHRLLALGRLLEGARAELEELDENWVKAKQKYETAFARAFLTSQLSSDLKRKYDAVHQTADLCLDAEIKKQLLRACKERIDTLRDQMEIARSVGAASRVEVAATNWTQP